MKILKNKKWKSLIAKTKIKVLKKEKWNFNCDNENKNLERKKIKI